MGKKKPEKHFQLKIIDGEKYLKPYTEEAIKKVNEFKNNQIVKANPIGETDWRSVGALGLYFQACNFVTERSNHINCGTYKKVDVFTRAECDLYDLDNSIKDFRGNLLYSPLLSIAFHNMNHLDSCNYFNDAYGFMSGLVPGYGFDTERFINDVKASCIGRR